MTRIQKKEGWQWRKSFGQILVLLSGWDFLILCLPYPPSGSFSLFFILHGHL